MESSMRVLYLHGFASSDASSKATFLAQRLQEQGISMRTPDLNLPDFSHTDRLAHAPADARRDRRASRRAARADRLQPRGLRRHSRGRREAGAGARLVLLAPAIDFGATRMRQLGNVGPGEWKRSGRLNVFHFGFGRMMPVHYELYEDASHYSARTRMLPQPDPRLPGATRRCGGSRQPSKHGRAAGRTSSSTCSTTIISWRPACRSSGTRSESRWTSEASSVRPSPANPAIVGLDLFARRLHADEIQDDLVGRVRVSASENSGARVADHDHVRVPQHLVDRVAQQRRQVGNLLVDVALVRADQPWRSRRSCRRCDSW